MTKRTVKLTEGEPAPDLSPEEFRQMAKQQIRKKPTGVPRTPKQIRPKTDKALDLPRLCEAQLGWSPRITIYVFDEQTLQEYAEDTQHFFPQTQPFQEVGAWKVRERGAYFDERSESDMRVVEVVKR